jgi:glycosyl transferase, family 25
MPQLNVELPSPLRSNLSAFAYFDHVYVINLERDTDRMTHMTSRLAKMGVPFERFAALAARGDEECAANPTLPPEYFASAASHRAVLCRAIASGKRRILILEDDVVFRDDTNEKLREVLCQLTGRGETLRP